MTRVPAGHKPTGEAAPSSVPPLARAARDERGKGSNIHLGEGGKGIEGRLEGGARRQGSGHLPPHFLTENFFSFSSQAKMALCMKSAAGVTARAAAKPASAKSMMVWQPNDNKYVASLWRLRFRRGGRSGS
jgi:hypothetical protein